MSSEHAQYQTPPFSIRIFSLGLPFQSGYSISSLLNPDILPRTPFSVWIFYLLPSQSGYSPSDSLFSPDILSPPFSIRIFSLGLLFQSGYSISSLGLLNSDILPRIPFSVRIFYLLPSQSGYSPSDSLFSPDIPSPPLAFSIRIFSLGLPFQSGCSISSLLNPDILPRTPFSVRIFYLLLFFFSSPPCHKVLLICNVRIIVQFTHHRIFYASELPKSL